MGKRKVVIVSVSMLPELSAALAQVASGLGLTRSALISQTMQEALPSLQQLAAIALEAKSGSVAPHALAARLLRAAQGEVYEAQMGLLDVLEGVAAPNDTRSGAVGVATPSKAAKQPLLRNRNKSGQTVQKTTSKGKKGGGSKG